MNNYCFHLNSENNFKFGHLISLVSSELNVNAVEAISPS